MYIRIYIQRPKLPKLPKRPKRPKLPWRRSQNNLVMCLLMDPFAYLTIYSCARDLAFVPTPGVHPPGTRVLF